MIDIMIALGKRIRAHETVAGCNPCALFALI